MDALMARLRQTLSNAPHRLYRALPSVLLGTLFNVLDGVSTGLLIFPAGNVFTALQIQAMSMYIMSTILSQVAMTLGGSLFPGALGAMFVEILPFLRGIGSDIRSVLGDDNPALVPTVMVAYALTSFLIGIVLIILGALKAGRFVAYFPQTVLTGAIGGIGVSLFILGLELTLPPSSAFLTISSAGSVLFVANHLPVLFSSCVPAFFLSISMRSNFLRRCSFGATKHAYYIAIYLCLIAVLFWVAIVSSHQANTVGMAKLVEKGWLFAVEDSVKQQHGMGRSWVYWTLFDFKKVEFAALKHAITNIVLLVVIGVLNLPIYVPALALTLDVPFDMNHEVLGQGAANILAGMAGTVPNILQLSYSVFFTRAGGGRFEACLVTLLTIAMFLVSSHLLPYVPTILASTLVLFLAIELTLEAVWQSAKTLLFAEWMVVMSTLIACTFLGFATGVGVGVGAAAVVYLCWGVVDTRARLIKLDDNDGGVDTHARLIKLDDNDGHIGYSRLGHHSYQHLLDPRVASRLNFACPSTSSVLSDLELQDLPGGVTLPPSLTVKISSRIRVIELSGYVFFATVPSLEARLQEKAASPRQYIIVDLTRVHRLETSVAQLLKRTARESEEVTIVSCGILPRSGAHADLERAGVGLIFAPREAWKTNLATTQEGILAFEDRRDSIMWCQHQIDSPSPAQSSESMSVSDRDDTNEDFTSDACVLIAFDGHFGTKKLTNPALSFLPPLNGNVDQVDFAHLLEELRASGCMIKRYIFGQTVVSKGDGIARVVFVVRGCVLLENLSPKAVGPTSRLSIRDALISYAQTAYFYLKHSRQVHDSSSDPVTSVLRNLGPGDSFGFMISEVRKDVEATLRIRCDQVRVLTAEACTVEICSDQVSEPLWYEIKRWAMSEVGWMLLPNKA